MPPFRRTVSLQRLSGMSNDSQSANLHDINCENKLRRASLDTLVIPGRTRYPSNPLEVVQPHDVRVAASLLNKTKEQSAIGITQTAKHCTSSNGDQEPSSWENIKNQLMSPSLNVSDCELYPQLTTDRSRSSLLTARSGSSFAQNDVTEVIDTYNLMANTYSLSSMKYPSESENTKPSESRTGRLRIWGKLTRKPSSRDLRASDQFRLSRKGSVASLLGKRPAKTIEGQPLDKIFRVGGASVLNLPSKFCGTRLEIPTCLAATASYLIQHGEQVSGIFRIPGQTTNVNKLYEYYVSQFTLNTSEEELIQATVVLPCLPAHIVGSIHDVASTFKRFLWDLPGGILGSSELLNSLKEIEAAPDIPNRMKVVALAILSCHPKRVCIINAVFGLLAFLKQVETCVGRSRSASRNELSKDTMDAKSLGIIFAPILLGASDSLAAVEPSQLSSLRPPRDSSFFANIAQKVSSRQRKSSIQDDQISLKIDRANMSAVTAAFLIDNWENIVQQMKLIKSLSQSHSPLSTLVTRSSLSSNLRSGLQSLIEVSSQDENDNPSFVEPCSKKVGEDLNSTKYQYRPNDFEHEKTERSTIQRWPSLAPRFPYADSRVGLPWWERGNTDACTTPKPARKDKLQRQEPINELEDHYAPSDKATKDSVADQSTFMSDLQTTKADTAGSAKSSIRSSLRKDFFRSSGTLKSEKAHSKSVQSLVYTDTYEGSQPIDHNYLDGFSSASTEVIPSSCNNDCDTPTTQALLRPDPELQIVQSEDKPRAIHERTLRSPGNDEAACLKLDSSLVKTPRPNKVTSSMIPRPASDPRRFVGLSPRKLRDENPCERSAPPKLGPYPNNTKQPRPAISSTASAPPTPVLLRKMSHDLSPPDRELLEFDGRFETGETSLTAAPGQDPSPKRMVGRRWLQDRPSRGRVNPELVGQFWHNTERPNLGTLYDYIRWLKHEVEMRREENHQLRRQLDATTVHRDLTTLSKQLYETEKELKIWRHRARWAEASLLESEQCRVRRASRLTDDRLSSDHMSLSAQ